MCAWRESNSHALRHRFLRPTCIPISTTNAYVRTRGAQRVKAGPLYLTCSLGVLEFLFRRAPPEIRTRTVRVLNPLPLPFGIDGQRNNSILVSVLPIQGFHLAREAFLPCCSVSTRRLELRRIGLQPIALPDELRGRGGTGRNRTLMQSVYSRGPAQLTIP